MHIFPQSALAPSAKAYLGARFSFFDEVSKSLVHSMHVIALLNMRTARTLAEESIRIARVTLTAKGSPSALAFWEANARLTVGEIVEYQQKLSHIIVDAKTDLTAIASQSMPQLGRTARTLVDDAKGVIDDVMETERPQQGYANKAPIRGADGDAAPSDAAHGNADTPNGYAYDERGPANGATHDKGMRTEV